jgi:hypothetical protein
MSTESYRSRGTNLLVGTGAFRFLVERGLDPAMPRLFIIDGAKALSKAPSRAISLKSAVRGGRWVLTYLPAAPRKAEPMRHYFPTEE